MISENRVSRVDERSVPAEPEDVVRIHRAGLDSWIELETCRRADVEINSLADFTLLELWHDASMLLYDSELKCTQVRQWCSLQLDETRSRKRIMAEQFGLFLPLRQQKKSEYESLDLTPVVCLTQRRSRKAGSTSSFARRLSASTTPKSPYALGDLSSRCGSHGNGSGSSSSVSLVDRHLRAPPTLKPIDFPTLPTVVSGYFPRRDRSGSLMSSSSGGGESPSAGLCLRIPPRKGRTVVTLLPEK